MCRISRRRRQVDDTAQNIPNTLPHMNVAEDLDPAQDRVQITRSETSACAVAHLAYRPRSLLPRDNISYLSMISLDDRTYTTIRYALGPPTRSRLAMLGNLYALAMLLCVLRPDRIMHLCLHANADNFEAIEAHRRLAWRSTRKYPCEDHCRSEQCIGTAMEFWLRDCRKMAISRRTESCAGPDMESTMRHEQHLESIVTHSQALRAQF